MLLKGGKIDQEIGMRNRCGCGDKKGRGGTRGFVGTKSIETVIEGVNFERGRHGIVGPEEGRERVEGTSGGRIETGGGAETAGTGVDGVVKCARTEGLGSTTGVDSGNGGLGAHVGIRGARGGGDDDCGDDIGFGSRAGVVVTREDGGNG